MDQLALTNQLPLFCEAKVCCSGHPIIQVGDLDADPSVIPSLAKGISDGGWIDLEKAFALGKEVAPAPTFQFQQDEDRGTRRDFTSDLMRWLPPPLATFSLIVGSLHTFRSSQSFPFPLGMPTYTPTRPACQVQCTDRSRSSSSKEAQNVWNVFSRT